MAEAERLIVVAGATGQQGGAVLRRLQGKGWKLRGITRDPAKPAAQRLRAEGVEIVAANLDDRPSLDRALAGAYGLYSVQTFREEGTTGEERQGKTLADAAAAAGIQHVVYASVGGADKGTGIPHFESKWQIEEHSRSLGLPLTVLRPVFFMENFLSFSGPRDGVLAMALSADRPLPMIAVDDIGGIAALAFEQRQQFLHQALEIAGDEMTLPQVAAVWTQVSGKPVRFQELPLHVVRAQSAEMATMFDWFNRVGYQPDIPALRALYPPLQRFAPWLQANAGTAAAPAQTTGQ